MPNFKNIFLCIANPDLCPWYLTPTYFLGGVGLLASFTDTNVAIFKQVHGFFRTMEFPFDINVLFPDRITVLDQNLTTGRKFLGR